MDNKTENYNITSKLMKADISISRLTNIANHVRSMKVSDAVSYLKFSKKKGSKILAGAINSAAANGQNKYKLDDGDMYIKDIALGPGPTRKWRRFATKGRFKPILRRTANVMIKLDVKDSKDMEVKNEQKN